MVNEEVFPRVVIELRGGYHLNGIDRLLRDLAPLSSIHSPTVIDIDLSSLTFISATGLAVLVSTLRRLEDLDLWAHGQVHPPDNALTRNYLMRMDLLDVLDLSGPPEPFERKAPKGFRPLRHFAGADDYWIAAKELAEALAESCATDAASRASIRICLDELAENVVFHADSGFGGIAIAQKGKKAFEVAIVDSGIGIRRSLAKNENYAGIETDAEAIDTALMPRVTSTPERNAGIGLWVTMRLLADNGGSMLIRSGTGVAHRGVKDETLTADGNYAGTIVAIRANLARPLDISAVYRRLDQFDESNSDNDKPANDS